MVLHRVDQTLQIRGEESLAGVVTAHHVDQVIVHDRAVKAHLVQGIIRV